MSILQELRSLRAENAQLKAEKEEMRRDVAILSNELKKMVTEAGLESLFPRKENEDREISSSDVVKVLGSVALKFTTGKLKMSYFKEKWSEVSPVISKYSYLIQEKDV